MGTSSTYKSGTQRGQQDGYAHDANREVELQDMVFDLRTCPVRITSRRVLHLFICLAEGVSFPKDQLTIA